MDGSTTRGARHGHRARVLAGIILLMCVIGPAAAAVVPVRNAHRLAVGESARTVRAHCSALHSCAGSWEFADGRRGAGRIDGDASDPGFRIGELPRSVPVFAGDGWAATGRGRLVSTSVTWALCWVLGTAVTVVLARRLTGGTGAEGARPDWAGHGSDAGTQPRWLTGILARMESPHPASNPAPARRSPPGGRRHRPGADRQPPS